MYFFFGGKIEILYFIVAILLFYTRIAVVVVGGGRKPKHETLVISILIHEKYHGMVMFQISSRLVIRNPVKMTLSSILELDLRWTSRLEMVILTSQKHHREAMFQISSRLVIMNPIKMTPSSILELDLRWWWVKTEGGLVINMTFLTVLFDYNDDCDLIYSHHIWSQLTLFTHFAAVTWW